jgi:hypothetical protein
MTKESRNPFWQGGMPVCPAPKNIENSSDAGHKPNHFRNTTGNSTFLDIEPQNLQLRSNVLHRAKIYGAPADLSLEDINFPTERAGSCGWTDNPHQQVAAWMEFSVNLAERQIKRFLGKVMNHVQHDHNIKFRWKFWVVNVRRTLDPRDTPLTKNHGSHLDTIRRGIDSEDHCIGKSLQKRTPGHTVAASDIQCSPDPLPPLQKCAQLTAQWIQTEFPIGEQPRVCTRHKVAGHNPLPPVRRIPGHGPQFAQTSQQRRQSNQKRNDKNLDGKMWHWMIFCFLLPGKMALMNSACGLFARTHGKWQACCQRSRGHLDAETRRQSSSIHAQKRVWLAGSPVRQPASTRSLPNW